MKLTTKRLARAGVTAGIYAAITLMLSFISFGPIQFRPAEALTLLPAFFIESPFALFVGCMLSNVITGSIYDIFLGSLITLVAGYLTRVISIKIKNPFILGLPPIILNALLLPLVFSLYTVVDAYYVIAISLLVSQIISVYLLGVPMYYQLEKMQKSGNKLFDKLPQSTKALKDNLNKKV